MVTHVQLTLPILSIYRRQVAFDLTMIKTVYFNMYEPH